jgi:hypothetical protein
VDPAARRLARLLDDARSRLGQLRRRDHRRRDPRFFDLDPFARIFPGAVVQTDLFSVADPPGGPAIEPYSGVAWPGGRFESSEDFQIHGRDRPDNRP